MQALAFGNLGARLLLGGAWLVVGVLRLPVRSGGQATDGTDGTDGTEAAEACPGEILRDVGLPHPGRASPGGLPSDGERTGSR